MSKDQKPIAYKIQGLEQDEQTQTFVKDVLKANLKAGQRPSLEVEKAMRSRGYYNAVITVKDETIMIKPGKVTTISAITITPVKYKNRQLNIKAGDPLDAQKVINAQNTLYKELQKDSCAFDLDVTHGVILDPITNTAEVRYAITQGRDATLGSAVFTGSKTVKQSYIQTRANWKEDTCFKRDKVSKTRQRLLETGLFSQIDIIMPDRPEKDGKVPVKFVLTESPHRTVRAGLSYYTDEGPGAVLGWQHRNFFGAGETLDAELGVSSLEQSLETTLTKPYFQRDDQTLSLNAKLNREDTDAYESLGFLTGFSINRKFTKEFSGRAGVDVDLTRIKEEGDTEDNFALLKPFANLAYDNRDDTLDPKKGHVLKASIEPTFDMFGESDPYFKAIIAAQKYYSASDWLTLASRLRIGSILGAGTQNLPASERFYAGGGGSVRGFGYQEVGPFEDGDPSGGRSLVEGALELRFKATDKIGAVTFLDFGQVDDKITPTFSDLSLGAGVGARYYTDFGPIRFDVGVPLNNDENTDQNYQIYISIGQAF